jgi:4-amino-4-deoxy-L-arabinose transferase-like glycosyltransferase
LLTLAIAVAVVVVACAFGMRLLRLARDARFSSFLERAVFAAALGLGAIAYLVLGLGFADALYGRTLVIMLALLALISWRELGRLAVGVMRGLGDFAGRPRSIGAVATTVFILLVLLLAILGALAPSSANDWDGLSYHLAVPKIYLQAHRIHYIGWLSHSNFPFTMEMLYALGLGLDGQGAAKLFHALCAALVVLALLSFGAAHWERRHGALAAVIFLSAPVVMWEATSALNDLAAALFTLLSLYAFINWWSGRGAAWLVISAALCGLAAGVKMTSLGLLGFLAIAAFYHQAVTERARGAAAVRAAAVFAAIAAAVASPWYIKSYAWTGNPVFPFFYNWFGGKYWTADAARLYRAEQLSFGMGRSPLQLLLAPWNLTMYGHMFSNFPERPLVYTSIGPLLLALLPGLLLLGKLDKRAKFLLLYSLVALCIWFALSQHMRYVIPMLPALSLCAGFSGSEILARGRKELRPAAIGAIALVCVISFCIFAWLVGDAIPTALGVESETAYLTRTLDGLYTMAQVINALPPGSKVIMYGETRGFYFDTPYMWGNHHHNMIAYDRLTDSDQTIAAYRSLGITHVLMTSQFMQAVKGRGSGLAVLLADSLAQRKLAAVAIRGNLILLRITEPRA